MRPGQHLPRLAARCAAHDGHLPCPGSCAPLLVPTRARRYLTIWPPPHHAQPACQNERCSLCCPPHPPRPRPPPPTHPPAPPACADTRPPIVSVQVGGRACGRCRRARFWDGGGGGGCCCWGGRVSTNNKKDADCSLQHTPATTTTTTPPAGSAATCSATTTDAACGGDTSGSSWWTRPLRRQSLRPCAPSSSPTGAPRSDE